MEPYNEKYERAKKRVEEIKGFYTHLVVYLLVNVFILFVNMGILSGGLLSINMPSWTALTTPFFWGIGLLCHGLYVFKRNFSGLKRWEERKIRELMEKDTSDYNDIVNNK